MFRKTWYLIMAFIVGSGTGSAQILPPYLPEQDACNALRICGGIFESPVSYLGSGYISEFYPVGFSTFANNFTFETQSVWFELDVATAGDIRFKLSVPQSPFFTLYGFSIYNITGTPCSNLTMSNLIRFTAWIGPGASGGLDPSSSVNFYSNFTLNTQNYLAPIPALPGEKYLICVHQYDYPARRGFTLDLTASTATFSNSTVPGFASVMPSCNNSEGISVHMNQPVTCDALAPDGSDFYITPGNHAIDTAWGSLCDMTSYSRDIHIGFTDQLPPGTYWLHAKPGQDGNTTKNLCGNQQPLTDSIAFTVAPYSPLSFQSIANPGCQKMKIYFSHAIQCSSIAADGSDFIITGPSQVTIEKALPIGCNTALELTDSILLFLSPLTVNGIYTITPIKGSDGNTVKDSCGQEQLVSDHAVFTVNTFSDIIAEPDTVLCSSQSFPLHAQASGEAPHTDPCNVNYIVPSPNATTVQSETVQLGTPGIPVFTGAVITPFLKSYSDARLQYIYHHSELTAMGLQPGMITEVSWFSSGDRLIPTPFNNFTIKMGCTTQDSFTNGFIPNTETVYSVTAANVIDPGWIKFTLQIPFAWLDTNNNLVIETCFDNELTGNMAEIALVAKTAKPFSASYIRYGDGLTGCAMTNTEGNGMTSQERPVTRLGYEPAAAPGFAYSWTPAAGLSDTTIYNPVAAVTKDIAYTVSTRDQNGCYLQDTIQIKISPYQGTVTPADTTICAGDQVSLLAEGGNSFNWTTGDKTISCTDCPEPTIGPLTQSSYTVTITDVYNCTDTAYATVNVHPKINVSAYPEDTTVNYGSRIQLSAESDNAVQYQWTPAEPLNNPLIKSPYAIIHESGMFIVTAISESGCKAMDTVHVGVEYRDHLFIPDAFTPNNDGLNDVFGIGNISFQRIQEFRVFNRWGTEIFSTNDPLHGWDGTYKSVQQPMGTYFYLIRIGYPDGYSKMYKGEVNLIR